MGVDGHCVANVVYGFVLPSPADCDEWVVSLRHVFVKAVYH